MGEIIVDPTGEPNDGPFLSVHLDLSMILGLADGHGILIDRNASTQEIQVTRLSSDTKYSAWRR